MDAHLHLLAYCQPNHCQLANTIPAQIATAYLRVTDNESVERYSERHTDAFKRLHIGESYCHSI